MRNSSSSSNTTEVLIKHSITTKKQRVKREAERDRQKILPLLDELRLKEMFLPIEPLWSCPAGGYTENDGRKKRLIFVHVFKTAGSTIRSILKRYARRCRRGYAEIVKCRGLQFTSTLAAPTPQEAINTSHLWKPASWSSLSLPTQSTSSLVRNTTTDTNTATLGTFFNKSGIQLASLIVEKNPPKDAPPRQPDD